jgi:hypothetical protein
LVVDCDRDGEIDREIVREKVREEEVLPVLVGDEDSVREISAVTEGVVVHD